MDLGRHLVNGRLRMCGMASRARSGEVVFANIMGLIEKHRPRAVVIDPLSALMKQGEPLTAADLAYRLVQQCKLRGVTLYLTSVSNSEAPDMEATDLHISTLADIWIHLSYLVRSGERNRALTIVKARGAGHSNQVRELLLSREGITLSNVYAENGEVLMGTLRYQREAEAEETKRRVAAAKAREEKEKRKAVNELQMRIKSLQQELVYLEQNLASDGHSEKQVTERARERQADNLRLRHADGREVGGKRK
jgi:circadian clock protein KaiC